MMRRVTHLDDSSSRRRYLQAPKPDGHRPGSGPSMAAKVPDTKLHMNSQSRPGESPSAGTGSAAQKESGPDKNDRPVSKKTGKELPEEKSLANKASDKALDKVEKKGSGTVGGEVAGALHKAKNTARTAREEGKTAAAADLGAAGVRTAASATGVGGAVVKGWDKGKQALSAIGINVKDRYVIYILAFVAFLQILPVIFVFFTVVYFWEHPAQALNLGFKVIKHKIGWSVNTTIDQGGASRLAYEVPVGRGNLAEAATTNFNPATMPPVGSYAWKLTQIDWEKAKYQTLPTDSNCNVVTQKVRAPDGRERSVVDRVELKTNPGKDLEGLARANCLEQTYPIFNAMMRSWFIREGINKNMGIRYAYALPQDSKQLDGKTRIEQDEILRNKTLDRIWKSSGKGVTNYTTNPAVPDTPVADRCGWSNFDCFLTRGLYAYPTNPKYPEKVIKCANNFNYDGQKNLTSAIAKSEHDLTCGIEPADLKLFFELPKESDLTSTDQNTVLRAKLLSISAICQINTELQNKLKPAVTNYGAAVKDRIKSEANAAFQAFTYAHTNRARFLNINELNTDAYKIYGMSKAQEYQHNVNDVISGEPTTSDAISRAFGVYSLKGQTVITGTTSRDVPIYNDPKVQAAIDVMSELNGGAPGFGWAQPEVACQTATNWDTYATSVSAADAAAGISTFYDKYYPRYRSALATLDAYSRTQSGLQVTAATAAANIHVEDLLLGVIKIRSGIATAGVEDGPQNFNRMDVGITAYNNSLSLSLGGKFSTENEAVATENLQRSILAYEDRSRGIAYRLFNTENPRSFVSRLASATIDRPDKVLTNVGSMLGNFLNPAKNLVGSSDSLAYALTSQSNVAQAASSYEMNNLKLDPAAIPEGFFEIDSIKNGAAMDSLTLNNSNVAVAIIGWQTCFNQFMPSRFNLLNPDDSMVGPYTQKELYTNYCQEIFEINAPTRLANPALIQQAIDNPGSLNIDNPATRRDLSFMWRAFNFYNQQADALMYLSNPDQVDESFNANSKDIAATIGENDVAPAPVGGVAPPTGDRNAPCPAGTTDAGTGEKYGPGRVLQYTMRLCNVKGIRVSVTIAANLLNMLNAAENAGIRLSGGGYRTYDEQVRLRAAHGCSNSSMPSSSCHPPTAQPGKSNHESGEAIDFRVGGSSITRGSAAFNWLSANANSYGLYNLPAESWHWSKDGR